MSVDAKVALLGLLNAALMAAGNYFQKMNGVKGGRQGLYLSAAIHKAFIEVDEQGTEAAAATGVVASLPLAMPRFDPPAPVFRADHPFLFLIRDKYTGCVLFLGRVSDPAGLISVNRGPEPVAPVPEAGLPPAPR